MSTDFKTKDGSVVSIQIDEDNYDATVVDQSGNKIGAIKCSLIEDPAAPDGYYLKVTHAFLEGVNRQFLHQGIGTRCIELLRQKTGLPIYMSNHDAQEQSDGSRLTGDGPAFSDKLEKLELISRK